MELISKPVAMKDRIREAREALGISQNALARLADVNFPTYHKIETGQRTDISAAILLKIARALGKTVEDLLGPDVPWPGGVKQQAPLSDVDRTRLDILERKVDALLSRLDKLPDGR
jgi:transcriptional regulator with XRE-family HTH domain